MKILSIILIGLSLSMDAFSLALFYGSKGINNKNIIKLSISVGIFHFIMPLIGYILGSVIFSFIKIDTNIIIFVILSVIGIEIIVDGLKQKKDVNVCTIEILGFSLAVSIDSFSVGIGLTNIIKNVIISPIIFSLISFMFTYIGLKIGKFLSNKFGSIATTFGGILLIILGIFYIM